MPVLYNCERGTFTTKVSLIHDYLIGGWKEEAVVDLLQHLDDVDKEAISHVEDFQGRTILVVAVQRNFLKVVEILLVKR